MNEETAKAVYERALAFDAVLTSLRQTVETIEDEDLRKHFTIAVFEVTGLIFRDIMHLLERRYPNLIPERER